MHRIKLFFDPKRFLPLVLVFFSVCVLLINPSSAFAARLFSSGCEFEIWPGGVRHNNEWLTGASPLNPPPGPLETSMTVKHSGRASCKSNHTSAAWSVWTHQFALASAVYNTNTYARFYLNIETLPAIDAVISTIGSAAVVLGADGKLRLYDNTGSVTLLGTAGSALQTDTWYRIEIGTTNSTTQVEVRVDGVPVVSGSIPGSFYYTTFQIGMCFTANTSTAFCKSTLPTTGVLYFDDIALNDSTGSYQNSWPGEGSIALMHPNASGDANACTSGDYSSVADVDPDGDLSYCVLNAGGSILDVNLESALSAGISAQSIQLVQVAVEEAASSNSSESWKLRIKSAPGATLATGATVPHDDNEYQTNGDYFYNSALSTRNYSLTSYVDPTTGIAWTSSGTNSLDTMQIGIEAVDANPSIKVTALWALVEYVATPPPPPPPAPGDDLSGFAWSPNIGWVSFNCADVSCVGTNYKVSVSGDSSRELYGHAWSSAVGWISFDSADLTSCPASPCSAQMNSTTGEVTGWAKALSAEGSQSGGWGGWVRLRGPNYYGVLANETTWSGFAWGGSKVTGTGEFSPLVGGNANIGWISFSGFTSDGQPYGVVASPGTTGEGPAGISCGVSKGAAAIGANVVWSAVVDPGLDTVSGPFTFQWSLAGGSLDDGAISSSITTSYATAGFKTASLIATAASGAPYVVDCKATPVTGSPSPWFEKVFVGDINLDAQALPAVSPATLQAGVDTAHFTASITCYDGTGGSEGCDVTSGNPLTTPFDNVIQIVQGHQTNPTAVADYFVVTNPTIASIYEGQYVPISADWVIPETACAWGGGQCEFSARACADVSVSPGPVFVSWDGVICEKGETNCLGSYNNNNCSDAGWRYFYVQPADAPPPSGGTCRAVPGITQVGKTVNWTIDPASIVGGEPPLEYKWEALPSNTGADALLGTYSSNNIEAKIYDNASPPTKRAQVTIRDSLGRESAPIECAGIVRIQKLIEF